MPDAILIYITCANQTEADIIGRALVDERLVACVNILPGMRSLYRWQGKVESAEETVLIAKTATTRFADVESRVKRLHSYTVPCIVALPVITGSADYLAWIAAESAPE
jgi:periplasmic divalent cation tolerance protein